MIVNKKTLYVIMLVMNIVPYSIAMEDPNRGRPYSGSSTPPCPFQAVAGPQDLELYPIEHRYSAIRTYLKKPLREYSASDFQALNNEIRKLEGRKDALRKDVIDRLITFKILVNRLGNQTPAQISAADAMDYESTANALHDDLMELD